MQFLWWIIGAVVFAVAFVFLLSFAVYRRAFYFKNKKTPDNGEIKVLEGTAYNPYREDMINWIKAARALKHEDVEIESFDGLKLRGRYFECKKGAPIEILFHGYKGSSERDLSGGIERCFALGRNALLVDQRGSGRSEGHVVSFGINERKDCKRWVEFAIKRFGDDVQLGITGVSMGAATVIMATDQDLPHNVRFVLADCGYSSAKEIIKKCIREMKLPATLLYPFVKLGARIYGGFDLEETSPIEAAKNCKIPIIFIHGGSDDFVPFDMSRQMYEVCTAEKKRLVNIPHAGHGMAYPAAKQQYIDALRKFEESLNT